MTTIDLGELRTRTDGIALAGDDRKLTRKDFSSDQEVRWCPGCGDYSILAAVQAHMPELGVAPENTVVISGIGCSSRFPYYIDSYGMHGVHGRAPTIATGVAVARGDVAVWVASGDGDSLAIGGNHTIHMLRRNVNITMLVFNNRIYGLTKGQYSPTSPQGTVSKTSPMGSVDHPFSPVRLALGADASFVARSMAADRQHLAEMLRRAAQHRGSAFIEIYQNCPIFNDGAYDVLKDETEDQAHVLRLEDGQPLRLGKDRVVVRDEKGGLKVVAAESVPESDIVICDSKAEDPSLAFALASLEGDDMACVPMGVFRDVQRPAYDDMIRAQIAEASKDQAEVTDDDLWKLFAGQDTWVVG